MKPIAKLAAISALTLGLAELVCYAFAHLLVPLGLVIEAPEEAGYSDYLSFRDPVLGWPRPDSIGDGEIDYRGSRIVPNFPEPEGASCVSVYGDSFTWGEEVSPEYAYPNVLAGLLNCRVDNFGVGGYGTDQALLRYQGNAEDQSRIVILGHFSENIVRNVNQFRGFYSPGAFGFKPRFAFGADGNLVHISLPELSVDEYLQVHERTRELLPYEYFVPDEIGGPSVLGFPYALTVGRTFLHYRIRSALVGRPSYSAFYDADHPSKALSVTVGILEDFERTARARNQEPVILLIPDAKDLAMLDQEGVAPYDPLLRILRDNGVSVIDGGRAIRDTIANGDGCELYVDCRRGSHFNADGYTLLASTVFRYLSSGRGGQTDKKRQTSMHGAEVANPS